MGPTSYLIWFVAMAVLVNVVIYGGISLTYFSHKRAERARILAHRPVPTAARASAIERSLRDAA